VKKGSFGTPNKLKVQLVARGDGQIEGIETFALVMRWSTIKLILALAAYKGWDI